MNSSLMNWLLCKYILRPINGYAIHFEHNKSFEKDIAPDFKVTGLYIISSNSIILNDHVLKKMLQVNRLVIYRCQILFFIKQNRFF